MLSQFLTGPTREERCMDRRQRPHLRDDSVEITLGGRQSACQQRIARIIVEAVDLLDIARLLPGQRIYLFVHHQLTLIFNGISTYCHRRGRY